MLTLKMQIRAIANRLAGLPAEANGAEFTEPWKSCWQALESAAPGQERDALLEALRRFPNCNEIIGQIFAVRPGSPLGEFKSVGKMRGSLEPVTWVWPGWIPRGMLTILGAVPGAGKSYIALDLARRIIMDEPFPDGQRAPQPGRNILYVDAEAVPQITGERVGAWNMDEDKLYLMEPAPDASGCEMVDFDLAYYRDLLVEMVAQLKPELVIIDSLSTCTSKGENNVEDVRKVLGYFIHLAKDFQTGLLLIHHVRKGGLQARLWELSIDDLRGSGHISAQGRTVLGVSVVQAGPKPNRNGPRRFELIKSNLGIFPQPLGLEILPLEPKGAYLKWGLPPVTYKEPSSQDRCKQWLIRRLSQAGEMRPKEVVELAEAEGFSQIQVYRAREALGRLIASSHGRQNPLNTWVWVGNNDSGAGLEDDGLEDEGAEGEGIDEDEQEEEA